MGYVLRTLSFINKRKYIHLLLFSKYPFLLYYIKYFEITFLTNHKGSSSKKKKTNHKGSFSDGLSICRFLFIPRISQQIIAKMVNLWSSPLDSSKINLNQSPIEFKDIIVLATGDIRIQDMDQTTWAIGQSKIISLAPPWIFDLYY